MKKTAIVALLALLTACAPKSTWAPAGDHIKTRWAAKVSPSDVHPEYPRPQMVRDSWKSLNGLWDYAVTPSEAEQMPEPEGQILVPFCIESSLSGVGRRIGADQALWYSTTFNVPWKGSVLLHFDAVDWKAEVWLNGKPLGVHTGGYTAFSFDITDHLVKGPQTLVLKVLDSTDNDTQPRGKQVSNPGGIWYTPVTGIWQSVWMEPVPAAYVKDYKAVADIDASTLTVTPFTQGGELVKVTLREGGEGYSTETGKPGKVVASGLGEPGAEIVLSVPEAKLWSPEHPYLYALDIEVIRNGKVKDRVHGYTAMRKSAMAYDFAGYKRLGLNNRAYFQYGPLDQGWWPDGLYTAPTDEALRYDIEKTKEWGWNMIRKHIKVEPARWYYYCDQLGIVVWQDMPSLGAHMGSHWEMWKWALPEYDSKMTETAKATYYKEWGEIIAQLRNHPSIVAWVPFNEAWSQFDTPKAVEFTRSCDPTRLINSASGGNSYPVGDIFDSHNYPNPKMKFTSGGLQIDVLGEYGGIGWPVEGHLWQTDKNWGYIEYKSGEDVLKQYSVYAEDLMGIIQQGVSAAVYTQTTDVEGEVNGLMTYDRKVVKMDEERLRAVNQQVIASMKK
ncbi:MAG: beta-galactosidase [Bacteroidales bacterium]|nr:beta-galactosidase [Bacteroidales bacterium]